MAPLATLPADAPTPAPAAVGLPPSAALLVVHQAGVIVGGDGAPRGPGVTFDAPPGATCAAAGGGAVATAGSAGVSLFGAATGALLASLPYPGPPPTPGTRLHAAASGDGSALLAGGARCVWPLRAVARRDAVVAALADGRPADAAALAEEALADGEAWAAAAAASAGMALAAGGAWGEARAALVAGAACLDPAELFPAFPDDVGPWVVAAAAAASAGDAARGDLAARARVGVAPHADAAAATAVADALLAHREARTAMRSPAADTLAAILLARLGRRSDLRRLLSDPDAAVDAAAAAPRLAACGAHLALADVHVAAGDVRAALGVLRSVAACAVAEAGDGDGAAPAAAATAAAKLLADPAMAVADVAAALPWVLGAPPTGRANPAVAALADRADIDPEAGLRLLPEGEVAARGAYLEAVVLRKEGATPALRAKAALALVAEASAAGPPSTPELPDWERAAAARAWAAARPDAAAAAAPARAALGGLLAAGEGIVDIASIEEACRYADLWPEAAAAAAAAGDARRAVSTLALACRDLAAARAAGGGPPGDAALLALLLRPGDGRGPLLADAAALVAAPGASLDGGDVVAVLPDDAPLPEAGDLVAALLAATTHRRRAASLVRGLSRASQLQAAADAADAAARCVRVGVDRACAACAARLGSKVVAAHPDGRLTCGRCAAEERVE